MLNLKFHSQSLLDCLTLVRQTYSPTLSSEQTVNLNRVELRLCSALSAMSGYLVYPVQLDVQHRLLELSRILRKDNDRDLLQSGTR